MYATDAIARITLLAKRPDLAQQEFCDHWAGPHADIARAMPGIARYRQHHVEAMICQARAGVTPIDGVVEMVYADPAALKAAQTSQTARRLVPEDEPRFLAAWTSHEAVQILPGADPSGDIGIVLALHDMDRAALTGFENLCQQSGGASYRVLRRHQRDYLPSHDAAIHAFGFMPLKSDKSDKLIERFQHLCPASSAFQARVVTII